MWVCSLPCEEGVLGGVLGNRVGWEVWSLVRGLREDVAGVTGPLKSLGGEVP